MLKDPEKRAAYDQLGRRWQAGQDFRPPPDRDAGFAFRGGGCTGADPGVHGNFFEELFGHGQARPHAARRQSFSPRGEDHHARVSIDLEDNFIGATRTISLRVPEVIEEGTLPCASGR